MIEVNDSSFEEEVVKYEGIVLVDFFADWCGPCKAFTPVLEEYQKTIEESGENVKIVKINVDNSPEIASSHRVMSIPTVALYKNGSNIYQKPGSMSLEAVKDLVDSKK